MEFNPSHIFTDDGQVLQGGSLDAHSEILHKNKKTVPLGRTFVHGTVWRPESKGGTYKHYLTHSSHGNTESNVNYRDRSDRAKPEHYEPALRALHAHYSANPGRKFRISVSVGDEADDSHPIVKRHRETSGNGLSGGYVDLHSLGDIETFLGTTKAGKKERVAKKPAREEVPTVDTSGLGREPQRMAQGSMTTAEFNFWRRKGLGDSYDPQIMSFKQYIIEVESWDQQMTGDEDGNQYSVKKLYDFAKSKGKAVNVPIKHTDGLEWWHKSYSEKNPEHMKRMMNADTSVPVLGIRYGKKLSIADGLNRIKKAHSVEGKTHIPVYIMDSEDMWGLAEPKDKEK